MKKAVLIAGAAAVVVGVAAFGVIKWQEHSKKVAKCQSYLDKMTQIYEQDIERTVSRFRLLNNKYEQGTLSESDEVLLPLISNKVLTDVLPALTDIENTEWEMMEKCDIKKMKSKGEILSKKYQLLADVEGVPTGRVEELEDLEESGGDLKDLNETNVLPEVTTKSSEFAVSLSKHLKKVGAVMYSGYWCPHCHEQLELFGKPAIKNIETVECATNGKDSQWERCMKQAIEGFPSWSMPGHKSAGIKSLQELADLSGYQSEIGEAR